MLPKGLSALGIPKALWKVRTCSVASAIVRSRMVVSMRSKVSRSKCRAGASISGNTRGDPISAAIGRSPVLRITNAPAPAYYPLIHRLTLFNPHVLARHHSPGHICVHLSATGRNAKKTMEQTLPPIHQPVTSESIRALNDRIQHASAFVDLIDHEMEKVIVGQKDMVQKLLVGLLADGHIMLEGVPGLAKTMAIKALARTVDVGFSRIQFTPDLLPADLIGTMIYSQRNEEFTVRKGPIFSNFILADEINRAPAKVQSALLEAMQERQVTIGAHTYPLPEPFLVLATMNPIEQEGTYPLPEAQTDRFMLKVILDYPRKEEETLIIRQNVKPGGMPQPQTVVHPSEILTARQLVREVYMDEKIEQYIVDIVYATRKPDQYKL